MNYTCDTVNCFSFSAFFFKLISRVSVLENILHKLHVPVFTNFLSTVYCLCVNGNPESWFEEKIKQIIPCFVQADTPCK